MKCSIETVFGHELQPGRWYRALGRAINPSGLPWDLRQCRYPVIITRVENLIYSRDEGASERRLYYFGTVNDKFDIDLLNPAIKLVMVKDNNGKDCWEVETK